MDDRADLPRFSWKCMYKVGKKEITEVVIGVDITEAIDKFKKYMPADIFSFSINKGRELRG